MKKYIRQNGFTLIELLLVVALMSIAVGVTGDILVSLIRSYNKSQVINEIEQNANFLSQKLNIELRNATQIVRLDGTGVYVGQTYNEIEFIDSTGNNNIIYKVSGGGVLTRDSGDGNDDPLTVNAPPNGVKVSCLDTNNGQCGVSNTCFTIVQTPLQVVRISLCVEQAGSPIQKVFQGKIKIEDTIVVRDTY